MAVEAAERELLRVRATARARPLVLRVQLAVEGVTQLGAGGPHEERRRAVRTLPAVRERERAADRIPPTVTVIQERGGDGLVHASVTASNLAARRSEEHTSELQSLMRISYAVFCLKKKTIQNQNHHVRNQ